MGSVPEWVLPLIDIESALVRLVPYMGDASMVEMVAKVVDLGFPEREVQDALRSLLRRGAIYRIGDGRVCGRSI